ncbi:MAG: hypothetical protein Q7S15_00190 [bacterium]|nr:hypothetical protein [bacterium]
MSYRSEKEEDTAFNSLNDQERQQYQEHYRQSGGDVRGALDKVLGPTWFNQDGTPRGHRHSGKNDDE